MILNRKKIQTYPVILDYLLLNISFFLAAGAAQSVSILLSRELMFILLAGLNLVWNFTSRITSFYDDLNLNSLSTQFFNLFKNVFAQALTAIFFIFTAKEDLFTRYFILYYSLFLFVTVSFRLILFKQYLISLRKKGRNFKNLLIIGAGKTGIEFKKMIDEIPEYGYNFVGFVDNIKTDSNVIGKIENLNEIIPDKNVDELVVALPESEFNLLGNIIKQANIHTAKVHIIPDYLKLISTKFDINIVGNFPVITVRKIPLDELQWRVVKRVFDVFISLISIIFIFSWLYPLIALLTKMDSKGPVLFIQKRVGNHNRIFDCYKFRTMRLESQPDDFKPAYKDDPRVTKLGKFLRKSNIDELPQIFNVLKGDMSIVGPRPHALPYHEQYETIIEEVNLRHNVKPGITGWSQVNGLRGDVNDSEENRKRILKRFEYDVWYIENWSLGLDLQIIFLTFWQMLKGDTKGI